MSDPLFEVCLNYADKIHQLEFDLNIMKGLMILWMLIAIIEFSIIKVYKKGEK